MIGRRQAAFRDEHRWRILSHRGWAHAAVISAIGGAIIWHAAGGDDRMIARVRS